MNTDKSLPSAAWVVVVDDDVMMRELVRAGLEAGGLTVTTAGDGLEALGLLERGIPDLIVCDVNMPGMDGFTFVQELRGSPAAGSVPLIFLTSRGDAEDAVTGLRLGADDYLRKPFELTELLARVHAKLERPPVPAQDRPRDLRSGLLTEERFRVVLAREQDRVRRFGRPAVLAVLDVDERDMVTARFGGRADAELARQMAPLVDTGDLDLHYVGRDGDGRFLLLLPERDPQQAARALQRLAADVAARRYVVSGEAVSLTPVIGWTLVGADTPDSEITVSELVSRAVVAEEAARTHLDLQPVQWTPELEAQVVERRETRRLERLPQRSRTPLQIAATLVLGVVLPFFVYLGLDTIGADISTPAYLLVAASLVLTAALIWAEGLLALDPARPPRHVSAPEPAASALIAAYLPNESATIVETVESFLTIDYPKLQVVLAYNTPAEMPVQQTLDEIARRDPRFHPVRVMGSTSKAQNVNAALAEVTGEFVGVFDADHHPAPDAFSRAWRWLASGYDVVQGHCVIRNGDASWVARVVAIEFEAIYAVSHPGRARMHGFGVFGGSNGYWRTSLLRTTRMHGFMLTEDIDSSLRVVEAGGRIANDPALISRELAPTTVEALWGQRMRWAQGWFQVSTKHLVRGWRSPQLDLRQKLGLTYLLGWREVYPWLALQVLPIVAFLAYRAHGIMQLNWLVSIFVLATLFTLSVGPGQVLFSYLLAVPEIRRRRRWFLFFLAASTVAYTEWKNVIGRVAQLKELSGERQWKVTPRGARPNQAGPDVP